MCFHPAVTAKANSSLRPIYWRMNTKCVWVGQSWITTSCQNSFNASWLRLYNSGSLLEGWTPFLQKLFPHLVFWRWWWRAMFNTTTRQNLLVQLVHKLVTSTGNDQKVITNLPGPYETHFNFLSLKNKRKKMSHCPFNCIGMHLNDFSFLSCSRIQISYREVNFKFCICYIIWMCIMFW